MDIKLLVANQNVIFTVINIIILYLGMRHFLLSPINKIIAKRQSLIDQEISDANISKSRAEEMKAKYEVILQGADEESLEILGKAKNRADEEYMHRINEADLEASKIIKKANKAVEQEHAKLMMDIQSEIAGLALVAAGKVIGESNVDKMNQSLYNQFLTEAGDSNDTNNK